MAESDSHMFPVREEGGNMKLSTIQKRNNLNNVNRCGVAGPGNAFHQYEVITGLDEYGESVAVINFQSGARNSEGSVSGVLDGDLLEIVRDRLAWFQKGEYATRENAIALTHIEEALLWMAKRADDRAERGVLGTVQK
jgi:hypothetical protein